MSSILPKNEHENSALVYWGRNVSFVFWKNWKHQNVLSKLFDKKFIFEEDPKLLSWSLFGVCMQRAQYARYFLNWVVWKLQYSHLRVGVVVVASISKNNVGQDLEFIIIQINGIFVIKIVLVIKKKLLKFKAEDQVFAKCLRSLQQFSQTVKGQNNSW